MSLALAIVGIWSALGVSSISAITDSGCRVLACVWQGMWLTAFRAPSNWAEGVASPEHTFFKKTFARSRVDVATAMAGSYSSEHSSTG